MFVIGVDPGQAGGIAVVKAYGQLGKIVKAFRMPVLHVRKKKMIDAVAILQELEDVKIDIAIIEQVHAMPRQGVSSSFQFGRSYGAVEAVIQQVAERVEYVTPATWKKAMGLTTDKQASLDMAKLKFGRKDIWNVKANDGIAEAALLCLYLIDKFKKFRLV